MAGAFRMRQWILAGTVVAGLALLCQTADAGTRRHHTTDPRLQAASFIVGTGSTAGYFALRDWRLNSHGRLHGLTSAGAMTVTTMGCLALSPIVGTVMVRREPKPTGMRHGPTHDWFCFELVALNQELVAKPTPVVATSSRL